MNKSTNISKEMKATVILFKESGKYYCEEKWAIPDRCIIPEYMTGSPDRHHIGKGAVLVESQEPWGYPCLIFWDD